MDNIEQHIVHALEFTGYKVYNGTFTSTDNAYFVFLIDLYPDFFGNDIAIYGVNHIYVHFYCPITMNTTALRKQIREAIQAEGFTYPSEVNATDEHMQHIVYEFEVEGFLNG